MTRALRSALAFVLAILAACGSVPKEHFYSLSADAPGLHATPGAVAGASDA